MAYRYYGDLEGYLWTGLQNENSFYRFGAQISYENDEYDQSGNTLMIYDRKKVVEVVEELKYNLGIYLVPLFNYFERNLKANLKELEYILHTDNVHFLVKEYSDYILGLHILNNLDKKGSLHFVVEYY